MEDWEYSKSAKQLTEPLVDLTVWEELSQNRGETHKCQRSEEIEWSRTCHHFCCQFCSTSRDIGWKEIFDCHNVHRWDNHKGEEEGETLNQLEGIHFGK